MLELIVASTEENMIIDLLVNRISFQLRTGPYRVSIIASQRLVCNDNIIFAFGVE